MWLIFRKGLIFSKKKYKVSLFQNQRKLVILYPRGDLIAMWQIMRNIICKIEL